MMQNFMSADKCSRSYDTEGQGNKIHSLTPTPSYTPI